MILAENIPMWQMAPKASRGVMTFLHHKFIMKGTIVAAHMIIVKCHRSVLYSGKLKIARPVMRFATSAVVDVVEQIHAKTVIHPITVSIFGLVHGFRNWNFKHTLHQSEESIPFRRKSRRPAILSSNRWIPSYIC